jgi:DNA-binding transcriptional regulator GbsR (MarR family)
MAMVTSKQTLEENVERLGVLLDGTWYTPIQARIFAYLMLSDPPYQSFDDIQQFLGASKSAISNGLNCLLTEGTVEYITFHNDRKRYFQLSTADLEPVVLKALADMQKIAQALDEAAKLRTEAFPEVKKNLKLGAKFYNALRVEIEKSIHALNKKRKP